MNDFFEKLISKIEKKKNELQQELDKKYNEYCKMFLKINYF